jgi:Tfp pilus assembly protein PilO
MPPSFSDNNKNDANVLNIIQPKKALSKNQQSFNRLTTRIANLRKEIDHSKTALIKLSSIYNSEILPLIKDLGEEKIKMATTLASRYKTIKLTNKQIEEVEYIMLDLLDDAFAVIKPDAETEKLYQDIAGTGFKEVIKEEMQERKEDMQDQFYDMFGVDIDMNDFDDSPEGYARFQQKMQEQIELQEQRQGKRKKTKKQLEKQARLLEEKEIEKRTIRSIYMSLAKLLHPDTEMDEAIKKEKEEIMKEITKAYNENDLSSLLRLELQWVAKETDHLEKLTDDKLKIYIGVLKEQAKELEIEKAMQLNNPAFGAVLPFLGMSERSVLAAIVHEQKARAFYIEQVKNHRSALESGKLRAAIRDCIEVFYEADIYEDDEFPSWMK